MNRVKIISAVRQCCGRYGYNFRTLGKDYLSAQSPKMAVALLEEPQFISVEGRNHGRMTYALRLHLLDKGMRNSPETRSEQLSQMQDNLLGIFSELSESEGVAVVRELQIAPVANTVLGRGEVGVTATAEVEVIF